MKRVKNPRHVRSDIDLDRRIASREPQPRPLLDKNSLPLDPLPDQIRDRRRLEPRERQTKIHVERLDPARLTDRLDVGQPDAVRRQHARQRMHQDARHPQRVGDRAGMLSASAAKTGHRVQRHIMPARDRDLADRGGHIVDRDGDEPLGDLLDAAAVANRVGNLPQPCARCLDVDRLVAVLAEHARELRRVDPPEHEVAVGHRHRPARAVTGRPRLRARRLRPDSKTHPVEPADRSAARRDGVQLHHRRADADTGDDAFLGQLESPGVMRHIGRGTAHVEPDQA